MATIPINITVSNAGVDVNPTFANVSNGSSSVLLQWTSGGGWNITGFSWKSGSGQPTVTPNGTNRVTSSSYVNNGSGSIWSYSITISNGTKNITIDPEINNEPPNPEP